MRGAGYTFVWAGQELGFYGPDKVAETDTEDELALGAAAQGATSLAESPTARSNAANLVSKAVPDYLDDELNDYHLAGRLIFGFFTGLGPAASFGDTTNALSKDDDLAHALQNGASDDQ